MRKSLVLLCLIGSITTRPVAAQAQNQTVTNGSATTAVPFSGAGCTYKWTNDQPSIGLAASGTGNIASFTASNSGSTPVIATITATPVTTVYAYIPNYSDNTVSVVNAVSNSVIATIPVGKNPISVSVTPDGSKVYIGNVESNDVSVISTATNTVIATIPMGANAFDVLVNHAGTKVYVSTDAGIKEIDVASNTVIGTANVLGDLIGLAIDPTDGFVYTEDFNNPGSVTQFDLTDDVQTLKVTTGSYPYSLAVSADGTLLYVVNNKSFNVMVIDVATRAVIATIPVGGLPRGSALSPDGKTLYVTNDLDGTISVINTSTNTVTETIPCGASPAGINISPDGKVLYVVTASGLQLINAATGAILSTTPVGNQPLAFGNFLAMPTTCNSAAQTFTITVNPTPNVTATAVTGYISACAGAPSASPAVQQFKVNATAATGDVTATAPAGFEVSLSLNSGYGTSVTLSPTAGVINNVPVYVRSAAAAPAGNISGNVTLTEGGVTQETIAVSGFINSLPTLAQAADQVVMNGAFTAAVNFTGTANTFTWTNNMPGIGLAADSTGDIPAFTAINTGKAPVLATITVTNKNSGFAYIGGSQSSAVTVINTTTHTVLDSIAVGSMPYGMWQTPGGGLLYVTNTNAGTVSVINTATQSVIANIPVGNAPFGITGTPDGKTVYVVSKGATISVINTATQTVTATFGVDATAFGICLSLDGTTLYATDDADNVILLFNTVTQTYSSAIQVGSLPLGIRISPDGTKLYEVNYNDNTLDVISTATNSVINTIPVGQGPHDLTISADGSTVYTSNQTDNTISVVNTTTETVTATIPVGMVPDGSALSPDGTTLWVTNLNSSNVMVINTATNAVTNTVPVGSFPGSIGNFVGNEGCPSQPMTFTIKILPTAPSIVVTGTLIPRTTVYGTPSPADSFAVSGSNLTAGIVITPPAGFEVSTDGTTFSSTVTIGDGATVSPTTIYIRLAALSTVNTYTGNIGLASDGATSQELAIPASIVTPAPLTISANDTSRPYGQANPIFTFTYSGFQNNETVEALVVAPHGTTPATISSPAGDTYPITPEGAEDSNYIFDYMPGTLKITPVNMAVSIPNAFTPNGDGKNDTWGIRNLANYPNCRVTVFDRYGQAVFTSIGYGEPWNGRRNGTDVPAGTYVYAIDLGNGTKPMTGTVIVIR
jgi:gliding motility-associated-like protein